MTILLIDSYDSFTFNLKSLVENAVNQPVVTIHNDSVSIEELRKFLPLFDAVIVGPGPGHPQNSKDVGIIPFLFDGGLNIPILGICLGFQSLCLSQGCEVNRLPLVQHGQVYKIYHNGDQLFHGTPKEFRCVRYHSLFVPKATEHLVELAWTLEEKRHEQILMAVKHKTKPWFGTQYHPESICSEYGEHLIKNFVNIAHDHNHAYRKIVHNDPLLTHLTSCITINPLISHSLKQAPNLFKEVINTKKSIIEIADKLHRQEQEFILLNSASCPGNWSIIGLPSQYSTHITHSTEDPDNVKIKFEGTTNSKSIDSIWSFISQFMSDKLINDIDTELPFIGGLMGIFSYEEGQYVCIDKLPKLTTTDIPDTKLVYIEDCILLNNSTNELFITSLRSQETVNHVKKLISKELEFELPQESIETLSISRPHECTYKNQFQKCQEYLHSGDSYELCLTVPTKIQIPTSTSAWNIYKTLTSKNPSPYSAYFNFDDCCLISSSPERFLSWDNFKCELRPIKGTVRKTSGMTYDVAKSILHTPKEIGENLMIVDLIRHDLLQLLDNVTVEKLMQVEEYTTVFQLVSVIKGFFSPESPYNGIDILAMSLPPGSMTGAPKKRSVEILQGLEGARRGLYSGVCGYWSINNKADWSVIIRSLFHYKDDTENSELANMWRIGAGGAITVLSDAEGEWQEMLTKLHSALQAFTQ